MDPATLRVKREGEIDYFFQGHVGDAPAVKRIQVIRAKYSMYDAGDSLRLDFRDLSSIEVERDNVNNKPVVSYADLKERFDGMEPQQREKIFAELRRHAGASDLISFCNGSD